VDEIEEGEELQYDKTAYYCLHGFQAEWPCLSFDVARDSLGAPRTSFPHSMFLVAGTQASSANQNYVAVMGLSGMGQAGHGPKPEKEMADGSESEDDADLSSESSSDEEEDPPVMRVRKVEHKGGINRVRCMPQQPGVVAVWGDTGRVSVFDLSEQLAAVASENFKEPKGGPQRVNPKMQFGGHSCEGWAMDWSPATAGRLVTGDTRSRIFLWEPHGGGRWNVDGKAFQGHTASVEDLQWSPLEANVFISGSVDQTVRVWDVGARDRPQITVKAHDSDVNVVSWSALASHMLASGGDDGHLKIWDLRMIQDGAPVADFKWHHGPIASVEWCPYESSMLVTTGQDGQTCVWDMALERDAEEEAALSAQIGGENNASMPDDVPAQLLFVHMGQQDPKEAHWHPQIPGMLVNTALDGFNVFKPFNV